MSPGSEIVFNNVTGTGSLEWYTFHYDVSDPAAGEAQIIINDDVHPTNLSELNSRAGRHGAVPVQLRLRAGDTNTIRFGASGDKSEFHIADWISLSLLTPDNQISKSASMASSSMTIEELSTGLEHMKYDVAVMCTSILLRFYAEKLLLRKIKVCLFKLLVFNRDCTSTKLARPTNTTRKEAKPEGHIHLL